MLQVVSIEFLWKFQVRVCLPLLACHRTIKHIFRFFRLVWLAEIIKRQLYFNADFYRNILQKRNFVRLFPQFPVLTQVQHLKSQFYDNKWTMMTRCAKMKNEHLRPNLQMSNNSTDVKNIEFLAWRCLRGGVHYVLFLLN